MQIYLKVFTKKSYGGNNGGPSECHNIHDSFIQNMVKFD